MPANQSTPEVTRADREAAGAHLGLRQLDDGRYLYPNSRYQTRHNALSETLARHRLAHSPARGGDELREKVAEVIKEDGGCWTACSGCQESDEGYVSEQYYPYSPIFQCQPGGGCRECGGIGVIWNDGAFLAGYGDALASTDMAGASVPDRLARRMGAKFVARDAAPQVEGLTSGEGFRQSAAKHAMICNKLAEQVPVAGEPDPLWWERQSALREAGVLLSHFTASPKATATASVREECAAACDRIADESVFIGDSEEGRVQHEEGRIRYEGIIAGARNCAAAIRRLTDSGTAATIGGERA